jgi:hypothetical protein
MSSHDRLNAVEPSQTQRTLDLLREEWTAPLRSEIEQLRGMVFAVVDGQGDDFYAAVGALRAYSLSLGRTPNARR